MLLPLLLHAVLAGYMPLLQMLGQSRAGGPALYNVGAVLNNGRYKIEKKLNSEWAVVL